MDFATPKYFQSQLLNETLKTQHFVINLLHFDLLALKVIRVTYMCEKKLINNT